MLKIIIHHYGGAIKKNEISYFQTLNLLLSYVTDF